MICSSGNPNSEHGHETTMGIFQIQIPKGRFYQFVNLEAAQYLTLIRSRTYFHSILYDKAKNLGSSNHTMIWARKRATRAFA